MKPIDDSRLINRLIANELIQNLFSYLFYSYPTLQFCLPYYLVFYQHRQLSCSILFLVSIDSFVSYSIQFFVSYNILFFVSIDGFISYNIQYQAFLFILDYPIGSIDNSKNLLDHLVSLRPSRLFYLYGASQISHYTM